MLRLHMDTKRSGGKYEIHATLHYIKANATPEQIRDTLSGIQKQLSQAMPTSLKARYNVSSGGVLLVRIPSSDAGSAFRLNRRVEDIMQHFIKSVRV